MRSESEQHDGLESFDYRELQLLTEVEDTPDVTQRDLARRVGIALGLTNVLLRNLTQKGYVRVAQATWKRRLYTLTPEGFSHRLRLMAAYVRRVLADYQTVRSALREQLEPLALNEESRVAIYGTGEFAELVYIGLKEIGIEEMDIYSAVKQEGLRFLGMAVRDSAHLNAGSYDRVVVALLQDQEATLAELREGGIPPEKLVTFFLNGKLKARV